MTDYKDQPILADVTSVWPVVTDPQTSRATVRPIRFTLNGEGLGVFVSLVHTNLTHCLFPIARLGVSDLESPGPQPSIPAVTYNEAL